MRKNNYKFEMIKKDMLRISIVFVSVIIIVLIATVVVMNNQREQLFLEGISKSMPLVSNDKIKMLGDLYISLNRDFEQEIKNLELNYANRTNKRGDKIHYGVNGKENIDAMINEDYVNGIESVTYLKGDAINRPDGDSNFTDMITFLSVSLGSDMDRYTDDELKEVFKNLFNLTHTFSGTSTELYPCEHGCSWCKYYCGDVRVEGTYGGDTVGFYKCDAYLGENGKYGLMYDPFLIKNRKYYRQLEEMADRYMTSYTYEDIERTFELPEDADEDDEPREKREKVTKTDMVRADTIDLYTLFEPEGYCEVHSGNNEVFSQTTRTFGGCINHVTCHHGGPQHIYFGSDDEEGTWIDWYMGKNNTEKCSNVKTVFLCFKDGDNHVCRNQIIGCHGYYECEEGHPHYACPGHILVCCFGHTNLKLEIKIMYYKEMIDTIYNLFH